MNRIHTFIFSLLVLQGGGGGGGGGGYRWGGGGREEMALINTRIHMHLSRHVI